MFRALDVETGRLRWETKLSPDSAQYFFHGDPWIAQDMIVVGADRASNASIHALDRSTGKELWKHPAGRGVYGPIVGAAGRVYAAGLEGQLLSLDVVSGRLRWAIDLKSPGPAMLGDRVFAGTVEGSLHALNADTGREEWRANLGAPVSTSVTTFKDDLYVGTSDGTIHRVDARRGTLTASWKVDPMLIPRSVPVRTADSLLVLLTDQSGDFRALVSVDPSAGSTRWRVAADKIWRTSRVFVWGDVIVLGTPSGDIHAYCEETGALAWSRSVKGPVRAIGGSEDTLLVGAQTGDLYALRAPRSCVVK